MLGQVKVTYLIKTFSSKLTHASHIFKSSDAQKITLKNILLYSSKELNEKSTNIDMYISTRPHDE